MNDRNLIVVALLAVLLAPIASADVLVTKDGARLETQGPWEVRRSQVIFTTPGGVLSSMRLSEVDLEASERATNAPPEPAKETEPAPKVVWSLTNDDIPEASGAEEPSPGTLDDEDDEEASPQDEEDAEEPEAEEEDDRAVRCRPNLTPGSAMLSRRTVRINGAVVPQADCPKIGQIHWTWGDGRASYSWFPAEHTYAAPGRYLIVVTARDLEGHEARRETTITVQ